MISSIVAVVVLTVSLIASSSLSPITLSARAATTLIVTTAIDSSSSCPGGSGQLDYTLRCAITQANSDYSTNGAADTILFQMAPNESCCDIKLGSQLPPISASGVTIDGYTANQSGPLPPASPNTNAISQGDNARITITIDGIQLPAGTDGLVVEGSDDVIRGLDIVNFHVDSTGSGGYGVLLLGPIFGGPAATGDVVEGNFIGVNNPANASDSNSVGIGVSAAIRSAVIGGTSPADFNVVSGNRTAGILLVQTKGATVEGNYIGSDGTGTKPLPNATGISIIADTGQDQIGATGSPNVISGNGGWGLSIQPLTSSATPVAATGGTVQANLIGVTANGKGDLSNGGGGIQINDGTTWVIGGAGTGQGNVVSGNGTPVKARPGIEIMGALSTNDSLFGNRIGITASGAKMGNFGDGVLVENGAASDSIGQAGQAAEANTIADNQGLGIDLGASPTDPVHVSVDLNSMYANGQPGIRLNGQNPLFCTAGPAYVANTTPNDLVPCPLILAATPARIAGEALTGSTVEIYQSAGANDDEGKTLLASFQAGTCSSPPCTNFTAWSALTPPIQALKPNVGEFITATATVDQTGAPPETSSFSRNVPVGQSLVVNTTRDLSSCPSPTAYSLRCAINQANADSASPGDEIDFSIPTTDPGCSSACTILPLSPLPAVRSASTYIDGYSQNFTSPNSNALNAGDNAMILVAIDGSHLPRGANGLQLNARYDSVEGLSMGNMPGDGVLVGPGGLPLFDIVAGCMIGTDTTGTTAKPNQNGVELNGHTLFATVGGRALADPNVISGNSSYGIESSGAGGNTIRENLVGVNAAEKAPLANGYDGVMLFGTHADTVGGIRPGEGNVISGNFNDGVEGLDTKLAVIAGNVIGLNAAGDPAHPLGNGFAGVFLYLGADNLVGDLPFGLGGNAIEANVFDGVDILAETGDLVGGNIVGYSLGNGGNGVVFGDSSYVTGQFNQRAKRAGLAGKLKRSLRNVQALRLKPRASDSLLRSELSAHTTVHPGGPAFPVSVPSFSSTGRPVSGAPVVGGETPLYDGAVQNLIYGNAGDGVLVGQATGDSNLHVLISTNSIASNSSGIKLFGSQSHCLPATPGPNDGLLCPNIESANTSYISGYSCAGCTVEVFQADGSDPTAYGEGKVYLGSATADSKGYWDLTVGRLNLSGGEYVTATATQLVAHSYQQVGGYQFETSEFSGDVQLTVSGPVRRVDQQTRGLSLSRRSRGVNWKALHALYFVHVHGRGPRYPVRYHPY
ncbi:MAG TPA: right-handed parallel beta-helix repeat-containing protein [Chloroflexota bacterium]|nr:right-handed parallel beta-helix repeat-containing protein [Chloroflexota bacterium]